MDPDRAKKILYGASLAGLAGLGIALIIIFSTGGQQQGGEPRGDRGHDEGRRLHAVDFEGVTLGAAHRQGHRQVTYTTFPPVSGRHYYIPAIWGNYTQIVDPRQAVHNQEHGGIDIWLGPGVSAAERQKISDFYDSSPNAILVTPIENTTPGITYPPHKPPDSKIYLTRLDHTRSRTRQPTNGKNVIATCPRFDEKAFAAFRDQFRGKGPERFPVGNLTPGT